MLSQEARMIILMSIFEQMIQLSTDELTQLEERIKVLKALLIQNESLDYIEIPFGRLPSKPAEARYVDSANDFSGEIRHPKD